MPFYDLVLKQKKKKKKSENCDDINENRKKTKNGRKMLTHYS